jgi:aspartate aminotransferase
MKPLAARTQRVQPSATLAVTERAKQLRAEGVDVIPFTAGEPDFKTAPHICEALKAAVDRGEHGYPPVNGIAPLREAVAAQLTDDGIPTKAGDVVISCGGKQAIYSAFAALIDEGDEVLIPLPYWVSYPEQVRLVGGNPVFVSCDGADNFAPTDEALNAATTPKTKAIVFSSPSNPAGTIYDDATLNRIADWAVANDAFIISDEIYAKLVFDGPHRSILHVRPDVRDRTILANGLSKAYAMTGWRLGYTVANAEVTRAISKIQAHVNTNTANFVQHGGVAALTGDQSVVEEMRVAFDRRRKLMNDGLCKLPRVRCIEPRGAFYCFPDVSGWYGRKIGDRLVESSLDFAAAVLDLAQVAVVPGVAFGMDAHIRLSYACSDESITTGLARLNDLLTASAADA